MSLAIDLLRYEWQFAFRLWKDDSKLVDKREWVRQIGEDEQYTEREYMRERAAEIVRLKRLEARVKELEMETEALQVQRAQAQHDARE